MLNVIVGCLYRWHVRNLTIHELSWLDDRLLADLGIERNRIHEFARICSQKHMPGG